MRHQEHYKKYKVKYPTLVNPMFSRKNWWRIILITAAAVLVEPLLMYRHNRSIPFSTTYYLQTIKYLSIFVFPFCGFLFWVNWRELLKRERGYGWVGKFEVVAKGSSFPFRYLLLSPGDNNKLKVDRELFEKVREGDFILIRRDALGNLEEASKVKDISNRLAKANRFSKTSKHDRFAQLKKIKIQPKNLLYLDRSSKINQ